ncbi:MAG TPA: YdcF family protein [Verrucomicrobiae bacterium]|nr:YdcF family protein [Verrucomicrobiae bacterium]
MAASRIPKLRFAIGLLAIGAVVYLARNLWLPAIGNGLIHDDGPAKADIAVVLGGDYWGHRILRAGELVKQGYVPSVLVSGPPGFYGLNEADAAIQYAVSHGCSSSWFIPLRHNALSTNDEAAVTIDELCRRNVGSFLLITSNYHSARARRIFLAAERAHGGGPEFRVVAAPDEFFEPSNWWHSRQAEKTVLLEWMKTVASAAGI